MLQSWPFKGQLITPPVHLSQSCHVLGCPHTTCMSTCSTKSLAPTQGQAGWNKMPYTTCEGPKCEADQREARGSASTSCVGTIQRKRRGRARTCSETPQPQKHADHSWNLCALLQRGEVEGGTRGRAPAEGPTLTSETSSFSPPEITAPRETSLNPPPGTCVSSGYVFMAHVP